MFCGFCFIHFLFCSSTIQPMLYILRVQGVFYGPCFTSPFFTSSRFAQSTFKSPGFTFLHIGIVHFADFVLYISCFAVLPYSPCYTFCVSRVFLRSMFYKSILYKFTFCTVYFQVTRFYVSTHRHSPCFGHKVHVLQRPRFLSSFFIRLCYIVHVLQIHVLQISRFTNLR